MQEANMSVRISNYSGGGEDPIITIYKAFRLCYSKFKQSDIKLPMTENNEIDYNAMRDFIVDKMKIRHYSPLEHICFTFEVSNVSRALTHQLVRHRTGKFNQQSQRYIDFKDFDFILPPRFANNKQAREEFMKAMEEDAEHYENLREVGIALEVQKVSDDIRKELYKHVHEEEPKNPDILKYMFTPLCGPTCNKYVQAYKELYTKEYRKIVKEVQEDARYVFSNAVCSNITFTLDLGNFRKFYALRNCKHAQWEIRNLAHLCGELVKDIIPFALDYAMDCGTFCHDCSMKLV